MLSRDNTTLQHDWNNVFKSDITTLESYLDSASGYRSL